MEIFSSHFLLCKVFDLTLSVGGNSGYFYLSDWWLAAWKFVLILDSKMLSLTGELTLLVQGGWVQAIVGLGLQWLRIPQLIKVHVGLSLSLFTAQVPLLWYCSEGKLPILWCDVFQERSRLGERDRQERSEQANGGVFTPVQTWNIAARISECQRSKSTGQSARGEGEHACRTAGVGGFCLSLTITPHPHTPHPHKPHPHTHTPQPHIPHPHTPQPHTQHTYTTHTHPILTYITHTCHTHIHHTHTYHTHIHNTHTHHTHIHHTYAHFYCKIVSLKV